MKLETPFSFFWATHRYAYTSQNGHLLTRPDQSPARFCPLQTVIFGTTTYWKGLPHQFMSHLRSDVPCCLLLQELWNFTIWDFDFLCFNFWEELADLVENMQAAQARGIWQLPVSPLTDRLTPDMHSTQVVWTVCRNGNSDLRVKEVWYLCVTLSQWSVI